jgi:hypothetical protein
MKERMFKVSGQGCPVALGATSCETDFDCDTAALDMGCGSLSSQYMPWNSGKIASSSAGNLRCDPFRKVCGMVEKFEISEEKWWIGVI